MSQIRSSGLSKEAEARLKRGAAMTALLNQDKNKPIPIEKQVLNLFALNKGVLDLLRSAHAKLASGQSKVIKLG